jgi:hypothetical protein
VGEGPGAAGRRHARDVDDVLHADRDSVQHAPERPRAGLRLSLARRGERAARIDVSPRFEIAVEAADPGQTRLHQLDGPHGARADRLRRLAEAQRAELSGWH